MSDGPWFWSSHVTEAADTAANASSDSWVEPVGDLRDPQRDVIRRWSAALANGDADEVERLVRQGRAARIESSRRGRLGPMLDSSRLAVTEGRPDEH